MELKKKPHPSRLAGGADTEMWTGLVPYPCVADKNHVVGKNCKGYLGSKGSQPHMRPLSPGFQCLEEKSLWLLAIKTSGDCVSRSNCWIPRQFLLKTYPDSLPLRSST